MKPATTGKRALGQETVKGWSRDSRGRFRAVDLQDPTDCRGALVVDAIAIKTARAQEMVKEMLRAGQRRLVTKRAQIREAGSPELTKLWALCATCGQVEMVQKGCAGSPVVAAILPIPHLVPIHHLTGAAVEDRHVPLYRIALATAAQIIAGQIDECDRIACLCAIAREGGAVEVRGSVCSLAKKRSSV
eukprot:2159110-Prymnesium_polylepis.1